MTDRRAPPDRQQAALEGTDRPILADAERTRCEIWTRVMGYHRPLSAFNPGKRAEHDDRLPFREP